MHLVKSKVTNGQLDMPGVALELNPFIRQPDNLVEDSELCRLDFLVSEHLDLYLLFVLEYSSGRLEVRLGAHCNEIVAVNHDGHSDLLVLEQAGVVLPLHKARLLERVAVLLGLIQGCVPRDVQA